MADDEDAERGRRAERLLRAGTLGLAVAHELRNALAVAETSLFLARRHTPGGSPGLAHLEEAARAVRDAQDVADAILALARAEPLRLETTAVGELIARARRGLVVPPGVSLEVAVHPPELRVNVQPTLAERALDNLLRNALEALAGRGRVSVTARADGDRVWVAVTDDGPGIDPILLPRIFEPLVTGKPTGTGLGLALARAVVEAHGGTLQARAGAEGGTELRMGLPLA